MNVESEPTLVRVSDTLSVPADWSVERRAKWAAWDLVQHAPVEVAEVGPQ